MGDVFRKISSNLLYLADNYYLRFMEVLDKANIEQIKQAKIKRNCGENILQCDVKTFRQSTTYISIFNVLHLYCSFLLFG